MIPDLAQAKVVSNLVQFDLKLATYNVLSAKDQIMMQAPELGRVALLRDQFQMAGYHIIGLQETRDKAGMLVSSTHVRFCSGADGQGQYGAELWFSLDVPFAADGKGKSYFFSRTDFVVLHSDPRILAVHCKNRILDFVAISAHSPHSGTGQNAREQWWEHLQGVCGLHDKTADRILLIDANARLHTPVDTIVGSLVESFPTPNEPLFVDFLASMGLFQHVRGVSLGGYCDLDEPGGRHKQ